MDLLCEAECLTCVAREGRLRRYNPNSKVFYCPECHKTYFCEVGIHKEFLPELRHRCPNCRTMMIYTTMKTVLEQKLDHARSLGVSVYSIEDISPLKNIIAPHSLLEQMMHQRALELAETSTLRMESTEIETSSMIEAITELDGIDSLLLLDILQVLGMPLADVSSATPVDEICQLLAERNPKALTMLFDIFIRNAVEIHPRGLLIRFALSIKQNWKRVTFVRLHPVETDFLPFVSAIVNYRENSDENAESWESWVIYFESPIVDLEHLNEIVTPLMSQPPALYASLKEVHLVAREFSWMVQQMLSRYGKIKVRRNPEDPDSSEDEVPIRLWVPHADKFREVLAS